MNFITSKFIYFQPEAFSTICAVYIEDCEGWWLSGCCGSVAEHWRLKLEVSWVQLPAIASFFNFFYFCLITSKFIYFQRETRCFQHSLKGIRRPNAISGTVKGFTIPIREEACELKKHTWYCGLAKWVTILMGMLNPFSIVSYTVHWR